MPKKGTKTKKKKTTKKLVVKHVESDEEILSEDVVSEEEVSSSEIDLLEEDSNGDANEVLDVSKTPDFESELSLLKPFVRQLNETQRLSIFLENFVPWLNAREKKRHQEALEDAKKNAMFLQQLNKTSTLLKNIKKKTDARNAKKANSNREYGFNKEIEVPKVFLDFFSKHLSKEVSIKKKSGNINLIKVSKNMKRPDITALLYEYCTQKNLKLESDKRVIKPDKHLRKLFGNALEDGENLTFTNFQTKLKYVFEHNKDSSKNKKKGKDV